MSSQVVKWFKRGMVISARLADGLVSLKVETVSADGWIMGTLAYCGEHPQVWNVSDERVFVNLNVVSVVEEEKVNERRDMEV